MGVMNFQPGVGEATFAHMSVVPSYCRVESTILGTDNVAEVLGFAAANSGRLTIDSAEHRAKGCQTLPLSNGAVAVITSGGNDSVCTSDADPGVRFYFGEGQ